MMTRMACAPFIWQRSLGKLNAKILLLGLASAILSPAFAGNPIDSVHLPAPTNTEVRLTQFSGVVRVFDSKGLILESNDVYFPRIELSHLSELDLRQLLDNKVAYAALTQLGNVNKRTSESIGYERQMHQIWNDGKTLLAKVTVRLATLKELQNYNDSLDSWNKILMEKIQALRAAEDQFELDLAGRTMTLEERINAEQIGSDMMKIADMYPGSTVGVWVRRSFNAAERAKAARDLVQFHVTQLARSGFIISNTVPPTSDSMEIDPATGFTKQPAPPSTNSPVIVESMGLPNVSTIPALDLRSSVDMERLSMPSTNEPASVPTASTSAGASTNYVSSPSGL